jgi:NAD(P)H-flavin reductase
MTALGMPAPPAGTWIPDLATISEICAESPGVATYALTITDRRVAAGYTFKPGQFNMLYVPGIGEAAISISSDAEDPSKLLHTVREAGNVTRALARKRIGEQIGIRGPFGSAWPMEMFRGQDVVIACGGIGLAPLRPAIYHLVRHRGDFGRVYLLYGARTPRDLLYADEYDAWRKAGIEVETTVDLADPEWKGNIGVVPVLFYRLRLQPKRTHVLACGPEIMMRFVVFEALARRVAASHIHLTLERNMNCAVGLCGHCQLGPMFICKNGPVFTYEQLEPYMHVEDL